MGIRFHWVFVLCLAAGNGFAMEYRCGAKESCDQAWWKTMAWLEENARFKPRLIGENRMEAKARTPAHKNRLEYVVERRAVETGDQVIHIDASCRASIGCPSIERKLDELFEYLNQANKAPSVGAKEQKSPIALLIQDEKCGEGSQSYSLRTSWAGALFEVECQRKQKLESLVIRCRGQQCKILR